VPSPEHLDRLVLNQASLPKARQWLEWLRYHEEHLPQAHGWQRGLSDCAILLHHAIATSARRLRGNPVWDYQGTMTEDTESLETIATRAVKVYESLDQRDFPERFRQLALCLYGGLRQMVRLAREIDEMRAAGQLEVDVLVDRKNEVAVEQ